MLLLPADGGVAHVTCVNLCIVRQCEELCPQHLKVTDFLEDVVARLER